ncbi:MAG: UDP-N-acetylglucosamine 2-epimerase, partial [Sphaerochaeta associata]|uniref:UDP-N-acetyl glucosamine 2-epimerase n=1 Tax=Sphaerochaeta associata TaxID=1129264 RepID=UPI002B21FD26
MEKMKVMTILGTRPEIIRLSAVIQKCDRYFNHILVHTGQNWDYTLNQVFFKDLGLRAPDYYLDSVGKNLGETMGNIIARSYEVIQKEKPDALLVLGDTNSALSAISAKRLKVPIFHMEAGNRCWDWNVPEMVNRVIVDRISDVNLPYTEHSRRYLLSEGFDGKFLFVTGSPMREVLEKQKNNIIKSDVLTRLRLQEK